MEAHEDANGDDIFPGIDKLNELLGGGAWFKPVHQHAGGNKAPQANVFMAAINHLMLADLFLAMNRVEWEEPEAVLLLVNEEQEDGFHVEEWRFALLGKIPEQTP
jgi:hypothetical protein